MTHSVDRGRWPVQRVETLVIGASQAGLAVSYHLTRRKRPHLVLERERIGANWLSKRWDSFTLVTPNWMIRLPGFAYTGDDPDGFMAREDIVQMLEAYAASFAAPIRLGIDVQVVRPSTGGRGYHVETNRGLFEAANVIIATGYFHHQRVPDFAATIDPRILQIHSSAYRNPQALPEGAVLVVGSAQSGCQIAEELHDSGRKVFLSVSSAGRMPRRYRGRDMDAWLVDMGAFEKSFEDPENPVERYRPNPHASGKNGGYSLNLHAFAKRGITLLGRVIQGQGNDISLAADLREKVSGADQAARDLMRAVDDHIEARGQSVPAADRDNSDDGMPLDGPADLPEISRLNLAEQGVSSIVWATGYGCDFSWLDLPVRDARGYPIQDRGISPYPGLYFCGLHWMHSLQSGLFFGVGEDANHVVDHLVKRVPAAAPAA